MAGGPLQGKNPSRDIEVGPCMIDGRTGLLLIERRNPGGTCVARDGGFIQITNALNDANDYFMASVGGTWNLSPNGQYRLSNRVAWALQLARWNIPVVLYYRGYRVGHDVEVFTNDGWGQWMQVTGLRGTPTPLLLLPQEYEALPAVIAARGH